MVTGFKEFTRTPTDVMNYYPLNYLIAKIVFLKTSPHRFITIIKFTNNCQLG